ncbi:MAG: glutathione S-transferase family protein [Bradymonadaceae bacterium]
MGKMIDGRWTTDEELARTDEGEFERAETTFRRWLTPDGSPGPDGQEGFEAEPGRYHLYVAINCPWSHRTMVYRRLKNLQDLVGLSTVRPLRNDQGWVFDEAGDDTDDLYGAEAVHELYRRADDHYTGRVTVPVLWDKERETIVNNESADIIRMFNTAFDDYADPSPDFYPEQLRPEIDRINETVYEDVNNGVYKCGFAGSQEAYEQAFDALFQTLEALDHLLGRRRYLAGDQLTEADWRLFPTLARFDVAYYGAFKCNLHRLVEYPNIWPYAREMYQHPGIAPTVDFEIYKRGYYSSHEIVPKGPAVDFSAPHNREAM